MDAIHCGWTEFSSGQLLKRCTKKKLNKRCTKLQRSGISLRIGQSPTNGCLISKKADTAFFFKRSRGLPTWPKSLTLPRVVAGISWLRVGSFVEKKRHPLFFSRTVVGQTKGPTISHHGVQMQTRLMCSIPGHITVGHHSQAFHPNHHISIILHIVHNSAMGA